MNLVHLLSQIVAGIGKAATYAVQGIAAGASAISDSIKKSGDKYKQETGACQNPKRVDEKTKSRWVCSC